MSIIGSSTTAASSTASSATSTIQNGRYWGLASGLDVDSIVTALVSGQQSQIDKANQQKQTIEWQQSAYQSIISNLNTFQSTYLDLIGSSSILSSDAYDVNTVTSSNTAVTATANADAAAGQHSINVTQSAAAAAFTGAQIDSSITGQTSVTASDLGGSSFNITVDGVTQNISLSTSETAGLSQDDLAALMQSKIKAAMGIDKVSVTNSGGKISIAANSDFPTAVISVSSGDTSTGKDALAVMGMTGDLTNTSNRVDTSESLSQLFKAAPLTTNSDGSFTVKINNVNINLNSSDSLSDVFSQINSSKAGVTIGYSATSGKITMTSSSTGAASLVSGSGTFTDTNGDTVDSGFFTALFGQQAIAPTNGKDAVFTLDGDHYSRSSNNFTIDSVTYKINSKVDGSSQAPAQQANINITADVSGAVKSITDFVNAYNTLVSSINTQLTAKPDSDYPPLTATQKSTMSDSDITNWNTKAQQGVLFDDNTLNSILNTMRDMIYQPVTTSDGKSISLYQIGITTSPDYTQGGTLQIDTDTLTQALQNDPGSVQQLFTKASSTYYNIDGGAAQNVRMNEEGIGYRLQDIISNATKTGVYPYVGSLVAIAGTTTDTSTDYELNEELSQINDNITTYQDQMTDKKNQLYTQFSQLETYMEQMNAQSSMLSSFGSGSAS